MYPASRSFLLQPCEGCFLPRSRPCMALMPPFVGTAGPFTPKSRTTTSSGAICVRSIWNAYFLTLVNGGRLLFRQMSAAIGTFFAHSGRQQLNSLAQVSAPIPQSLFSKTPNHRLRSLRMVASSTTTLALANLCNGSVSRLSGLSTVHRNGTARLCRLPKRCFAAA
ncbi:hypothetical protein SAMN05444287_0018 [Octadecabacter temperatus]|uniref:Uncharacterized protein n=1 Tax=Octadecabacter temperatus TaxID=1458307 RepID=A0A0K0Y1X3_9RHOB|nr:hypothetical protein OSB_03670 [Octadecabacter temperatus]SIN82971.1 hypothetical protein SAMN05444287_0018 [Octadecabacter temperatus]